MLKITRSIELNLTEGRRISEALDVYVRQRGMDAAEGAVPIQAKVSEMLDLIEEDQTIAAAGEILKARGELDLDQALRDARPDFSEVGEAAPPAKKRSRPRKR